MPINHRASLLVLLILVTKFTLSQKPTDIISPDTKVQEIFSKGEVFLEGPAMSPDGTLYFSDIPISLGVPPNAGIIWKLNPNTNEATIFRSPSGMSNGLKFDASGNLISCEGAHFGGRSPLFWTRVS